MTLIDQLLKHTTANPTSATDPFQKAQEKALVTSAKDTVNTPEALPEESMLELTESQQGDSIFKQYLQSVGLGDMDVAFTPLGRMKLLRAMQAQFGAQFMRRQEAKHILEQFDMRALEGTQEKIEVGKLTLGQLMEMP